MTACESYSSVSQQPASQPGSKWQPEAIDVQWVAAQPWIGAVDAVATSTELPKNVSEPSATDRFLSLRPRFRDDLICRPRRSGGQAIYIIEDPARSKFYRLGLPEYALIARLHGQTSIGSALESANQYLRDISNDPDADPTRPGPLDEPNALSVIRWAYQNGFFVQPSATQASDARVVSSRKRERSHRPMNPIMVRIPFGSPEPLLARIAPFITWICSGWATLFGLILVLIAAVHILVHWHLFASSMAGIFSPHGQLGLLFCWIGLKVIHELGHGIACRRYGGSVREVGLLFILFVPLAYVDVTSSWRFRSKWQRIHTALAGMYLELLAAAIAALIWSHTAAGIINQTCANVVLLASITSVLFNANPLMRFDGYYILTDLIDVPNLYGRGQAWLHAVGRHWFFGIKARVALGPAGHEMLIRVYAILSFVWRIFVCLGLIIAAACMWHGAGLVLAGLAVVTWYGIPLMCLVRFVFAPQHRQAGYPARFLLACTLTAALFATLLVIPWQRTQTAPAVVEYEPLAVLRAPGPAFVDKILVSSGTRVESGELVAVLRNDELVRDYDNLQLKIEASRLRSRGFRRRRELAALEQEQQEGAALSKRLAELEKQLDALQVRAPIAGHILTPYLESLVGTYLGEGDPLFLIGDEACKQLRFSIPEEKLVAARQHVGSRIAALLPAADAIACTLESIEPRGNTTPIDPALCAPNGGPLIVRMVADPEQDPASSPAMQLLKPHFHGVAKLAPNQCITLRAGQRATIEFAGTRRSVGAHLAAWFGHWLQKKTG